MKGKKVLEISHYVVMAASIGLSIVNAIISNKTQEMIIQEKVEEILMDLH